MSSISSPLSYHFSDNLQTLQELPFFITDNYLSPFSFIHNNPFDATAGFVQLPISGDLTYFQEINTVLHHPFSPHHPSSPQSHTPSRTHSLSLSFSSLPDLVPIKDISNNVPDLFPVHNTFDLTSIAYHLDTSTNDFSIRPPEYSHIDTYPPGYSPPWERAIILRCIRILQQEATDLYRIVDQRREENIAIYNAAVNSQLRDHDTRYQRNIEHLEDLLQIWS